MKLVIRQLPILSPESVDAAKMGLAAARQGKYAAFHQAMFAACLLYTSALSQAFVIPLLVFVIPIHVVALGVVLTVLTVMGVANHMGWDMFPRWLVAGPAGRWIITARHHQRHHDLYRCNYGPYFRLWDRLCGPDQGLGRFS